MAMKAFFAKYPAFIVKPKAPYLREFLRLKKQMKWNIKSEDAKVRDESKAAYKAYREAITEEFNRRFGTDETRLDSWQSMCARLGVNPEDIPEKIVECKKVCLSVGPRKCSSGYAHKACEVVRLFDRSM